jgi:MFS family permease
LDTISTDQDSKQTRFLLASFSLGHMAHDWAPGAIWLIAPAVAIEFNLSPAELGLLLTIQAVGTSLGFFPAGILADHVSHAGRLLAMTFWWVAIGFFVASFASDYWMLALLLAVAGLGDAAWHPIATGVLTKRWPQRRGEALGIHAIGGSLAAVLAPLAVGYLLTLMDWRDALRLSVVPAVLMGLVFLFVIARRVPASTDGGITRADMSTFLAVWLKPLGAAMLAIIVSYQMAVTALMSMTPLFLQTQHAYNSAQAGTLFAAALLIGALVQPWLGRISDHIGRRRVLVVGATCGAIFAMAMSSGLSGVPLIIVICATFGLLIGVRAVLLALAVDFASKREGTTLGFVFMLMDGVGGLGAVLAGTIGQNNLAWSFIFASAMALLTAFVAIMVSLSRRTVTA